MLVCHDALYMHWAPRPTITGIRIRVSLLDDLWFDVGLLTNGGENLYCGAVYLTGWTVQQSCVGGEKPVTRPYFILVFCIDSEIKYFEFPSIAESDSDPPMEGNA